MSAASKQWRSCPVEGCENKCRRNQVVCRRCWWFVPHPLRERIWELFRDARGSQKHMAAIAEAVKAATAGLQRQEQRKHERNQA